MQDTAPLPQHALRIADLPQRKATRVTLTPTPEEMRAIADELGLDGLRKLRFEAELAPMGRNDWKLTGSLGATVVQSCVVTLEPVTTRIDTAVEIKYLSSIPEVEGEEVEMPEDDSIEPLPAVVDLAEVMIESLSLNLPLYPRADGADPVDLQVTEPGKKAMTDEDAKPFAGLAALRSKLGGDSEENS
ncbi:DUF177 domain-containing protein [Donghicola sp. C2-DW-16]|uniref:DUF177 domain-containing protein n=1 Tax=Donghicola mangrovi TaxID=2729614 RepID=A0ABX2PCS7_9RHOB|nr:DUF177 domain-containing protein [Donghicola mangrovi]NVO26827.1 DUF177 domain-containing protein [Donghicola mangrovi]